MNSASTAVLKGSHKGVADVVVCGAGLCGISSAFYLSKTSLFDRIVLLEKNPEGFLRGTSARSSESFRTLWQDEALQPFMQRSVDLMLQFRDNVNRESSVEMSLNMNGYAWLTQQSPPTHRHAQHLAIDPQHMFSSVLRQRHDFSDMKVHWGSSQVSKRFPYVNPDFESCLEIGKAGWIDAQQLGSSILHEARKNCQVDIISGTAMHEVKQMPGTSSQTMQIMTRRTDGCEDSEDLVLESPILVLAAGPDLYEAVSSVNKDYLKDLEHRVQLRNERHFKLMFHDRDRVIPPDSPMMICSDPVYLKWDADERYALEQEQNSAQQWSWLSEFPSGVHLRPAGNDYVLVAWPLQGSLLDFLGAGNPMCEEGQEEEFQLSFTELLLRGASHIAPELQRYIGQMGKHNASVDGGFYTTAKDHRPVIGSLSDSSNVFVVGGMSGFGVMGAHGAGDLLARSVLRSMELSPSDGKSLPNYADLMHPSRPKLTPSKLNQIAAQEGPGSAL